MNAHHTPPSIPRGTGPYSDEEVTQYIHDMCAELLSMSRRTRLRTLHYLIGMVKLEADRTIRAMREPK